MGVKLVPVLITIGLTACGGGSSGGGPPGSVAQGDGTATVSITDGPMEGIQELQLYVTRISFGDQEGHTVNVDLKQAHAIDMITLQNGASEVLVDEVHLAPGHYRWVELGIDLDQSHIGLQSGGQHGMAMGNPNALRVNQEFQINEHEHTEFMLDFDLRSSVQYHEGGGMMGGSYELHSGMRLVRVEDTGTLEGTIDMSLVDMYRQDCDSGSGGNWAYLFNGAVQQPDDLSETNTDQFEGPVATDHVTLDPATGDYRYKFSYMPSGNYRVAFSCSSEWDGSGDDDFPNDSEGKFSFQAFSGLVEVMPGKTTILDIHP